MSRMRIATVVPAEHRVVFTDQSWEVLAKGHRYLVDNVREALSEPGQWYLDRPLGQLTYISKPGEQPGQAVVIAPRLEQLLVLQGDLTKKRWGSAHSIQRPELRSHQLDLAAYRSGLPSGGNRAERRDRCDRRSADRARTLCRVARRRLWHGLRFGVSQQSGGGL